MLPAAHRMRRSEDFSRAVRGGRRAGGRHLVVHLLQVDAAGVGCGAARVGVVVAKGVGSAATRTRVKRRLRALAAARLQSLPAGALAVLRASPASADATSGELGLELDRILDRVLAPRRTSSLPPGAGIQQ